MQLADVDTPSGVEDIVESTRLNTSSQSALRPNVTAELSDIPHTSTTHDERGASTLNQTTVDGEEQTPLNINVALSSAIGDLDIEDPTKNGEDDVFEPPAQTPQQIAQALSLAVGDDDTFNDRSRLEANIMVSSQLGDDSASFQIESNIGSTSHAQRTPKSTSGAENSAQRSYVTRSSQSMSKTPKSAGDDENRSSRSSQRSSTEEKTQSQSGSQSSRVSQGELVCATCSKKCKNKGGLKSHMKTHK